MTNETIQNLLKIALTASIEAGEAIMKIYEEDNFEVDFKSDNFLQKRI